MYRLLTILFLLPSALYSNNTTVPYYDPQAEALTERYRPNRDYLDNIRHEDISDAEKLVREAHKIVLLEASNPNSRCLEEVIMIAHRESLELRRLFGVRAITRAHLREYRRVHKRIREIWHWKAK